MNMSAEINQLLERLDGRGTDDEFDAIHELTSRFGKQLPEILLLRYRLATKWTNRVSCVYFSTRYAPESKAAIELGLLAVLDKAKVVRYRGCKLLAYSLNKELIPELELMIGSVREDTKADLLAAIDAIKCQNFNYFADRQHTGMITIHVI
jgi:hypothetical protein